MDTNDLIDMRNKKEVVMTDTSEAVALMQARYVLRSLDVERPGCGYGKLAEVCERAATLSRQLAEAQGEGE